MQRLLTSYRAIPPNATVRLAKPTSNLFRARAKTKSKGLDTSGLTGVIAVDPDARTADVAGMCTYEDLVAATLPYGLSPMVVPQLKTITLGGAVTGLGIESASFRNGLPHESVLEMDILTGTGDVLTASADQHADLYRTFPNSYGTLGYSVRLKIELESVKPFVALRHLRFHSLEDLVAAMDRVIETGGHDGTPVDYLDGVVFSADESYLTLGFQTGTPGPVSDYTGQQIYYRSIQHAERREARPAHHSRLPVAVGHRLVLVLAGVRRAEPADPPVLAAALPAQQLLLEADRLRPAVQHRRPHREAKRPPAPRARRAGHRGTHRADRRVPWLVPGQRPDRTDLALSAAATGRQRESGAWPLYPIRPHHTYVNVGFWSSVPVGPMPTDGYTNKMIEREVSELDGHKSLYSDAFYSHDEFDELYGGETYKTVKRPTTRIHGC